MLDRSSLEEEALKDLLVDVDNGGAVGLTTVYPVSKAQARLLNSRFVVTICRAGVMVKRLKPLIS